MGDVRIWIVAAGVLTASEICSAIVTHSIPTLYIHWVIKPILGISNAPTDEGFLGTAGIVARLLHAGVVVLAAVAWLWLASKVAGTARSRWYRVGQGLLIGGAAANAYQLLVRGSVLDWITFRPLVELGLHQGLTTYSLGDAAAAAGFVVLIGFVLVKSDRTSSGRAQEHKTEKEPEPPTRT
jgi:lipoprotein signal peptidase